MRLLTGLLFYGLLNDVALGVLALRHVNNMFLLHLYTLVSYLLLALLFAYWHQGRPARCMRLSILLFSAIYILLLGTGYEELQLPNKYSQSIRTVFIAFISLYTLYTIRRERADPPAHRDERFWVSLGAFISQSGNVLVYAAIPVFITHSLWQVHNALSIVGNILYFGAYLCLRR
ncbi:MAG: hypothetical protein ACETWG_08820 [Candidatus Neomarinimicrobiota bacterium]